MAMSLATAVALCIQQSLLTFFLDNRHKHAVSATFPVSADLRKLDNEIKGPRTGFVEAILDYPCFQMYGPDQRAPLDSVVGRQQARKLLLYIIAELLRDGFFEKFEGIRIELYDGGQNFKQYSNSGKHNLLFARDISHHSTDEREQRNSLGVFKATIDDYNALSRQLRLQHHNNGSTVHSVREQQQQKERLDRVFAVGELISDNIANFNLWRDRGSLSIRRRCAARRKTLSDLDLSRQTPLFGSRRHHSSQDHPNQPTLPLQGSHRPRAMSAHGFSSVLSFTNSRRYLKLCVELLIQQARGQFSAPLVPTSFYDPPRHNWYSMLLILSSGNIARDGIYIMDFNRAYSVDEMFDPDKFSHQMSHVSMNPKYQVLCRNGNKTKQAIHLSTALYRYLHLDFPKPLVEPYSMHAATPMEVAVLFPSLVNSQSDDIGQDLVAGTDSSHGDRKTIDNTHEPMVTSVTDKCSVPKRTGKNRHKRRMPRPNERT